MRGLEQQLEALTRRADGQVTGQRGRSGSPSRRHGADTAVLLQAEAARAEKDELLLRLGAREADLNAVLSQRQTAAEELKARSLSCLLSLRCTRARTAWLTARHPAQATVARLEEDLREARSKGARPLHQQQQQGALVDAVEKEAADLRGALAAVRAAVAEQRALGAAPAAAPAFPALALQGR